MTLLRSSFRLCRHSTQCSTVASAYVPLTRHFSSFHVSQYNGATSSTDVQSAKPRRKRRNLPKRLSGIQKYTLSVYRKLIRLAYEKNKNQVDNALLQKIRQEFRDKKNIDRGEMERIEYWVRYAEKQLEVLEDSKGMTSMTIRRNE